MNLKDKKNTYLEGTDFIQTANYANKKLSYYYIIPESVAAYSEYPHLLLVCVPGLSGDGKRFVKSSIKEFAREQEIAILAPCFKYDEKNWSTHKSYQYPSVWSGDALLKIIDELNKKGLNTSKLLLYGFSAGSQFVLRFSLWKPHLCLACAAHAGGGRILPEEKVDVSYFISAGTKDIHRNEHAYAFYNAAYHSGIKVAYRQYEAGHSLTDEQINDSIDFFKDAIKKYRNE